MDQLSPAQRALADEHVDLVRAIARCVWRMLGKRVHLGDLEGHGFDGLLEATVRYDATRGASFATFAGYRIRGAMLDSVRDSRAHTHNTLAAAANLEVIPLDTDELLARLQAHRRLEGELRRLRGRERRFVRRVYFQGRNLAAVGAEMGLSKSRASRIHASTIERLRAAIGEAA